MFLFYFFNLPARDFVRYIEVLVSDRNESML